MRNTGKVGRNDLCSCGSGRKFKRCCEPKVKTGDSRGVTIFAIIGGVIIATIFGINLFTRQPAPASGRVWSPEHGHYHNVP